MNPVTADANSKLRETRAAGQATSRSRCFFFKIPMGAGLGFTPFTSKGSPNKVKPLIELKKYAKH
jgi:hypothetical protein